jgi:hypothetical protein
MTNGRLVTVWMLYTTLLTGKYISHLLIILIILPQKTQCFTDFCRLCLQCVSRRNMRRTVDKPRWQKEMFDI